ncbi:MULTISPECIES: manganese-dependent inorganic pyrophosphatase [unclassified Deinococcus]|uniref:manganese-dependent inorganic pyrophosphatase n=1 Tax=unclassified Deinococcus TaxID=2623546 RepID=UPI000C17BDE6|nr:MULTISPECIES: manganese-dependent inorganic pyrophosphatase [unclassified Deinococcus]MCD0157888.1 manganese-dependent inorganic pyrophosphatase [Deinococcus sp. 6GRE01]MCD0176068.1 manganese-dependent inorganic pyrophosphatase [Deinococcus sp. 14RED07]PIG99069.1 manganese-dependent inorganic pyrophosphatase [Deinococcus sp. UR1]
MLAVFGHLNPDTDAITAALVYARLLTRQGVDAQAFRLGELNFETAFVLREAGVDAPALLPELPAGAAVALVDHNESAQSAPNLAELNVTRVVDHHKLGDLSTAQPAYLRFEPVGCTGTILLKLHREAGLSVEPLDARLMLSAVLSDTLHFRSPTTTQEDRDAVAFLAPVAGIEDVEAYALAMFAAKSDLGDTPAEALLRMDYKVFPFGDVAAPQAWGIGVIETTNPAYVFGRQAELLAAMDQVKAQDGLAGVLLSVVDILNETNRTLVLSATEGKVLSEAFGVTVDGPVADLGRRISRKKQIVPTLEGYFAPQG